jgi:hypothetical protein
MRRFHFRGRVEGPGVNLLDLLIQEPVGVVLVSPDRLFVSLPETVIIVNDELSDVVSPSDYTALSSSHSTHPLFGHWPVKVNRVHLLSHFFPQNKRPEICYGLQRSRSQPHD